MQAGKSVVRCAGVIGLCAGAALAVSSARAAQVTANWLAPVSGNWNDASKWSTPQFPNNGSPAGLTYNVVIDAAGAAYEVLLEQLPVTLDSLTINSADAMLVQSGHSLTLLGASLVQAGRYRFSFGSLKGAGDLVIASEMTWTGGRLEGEGDLVIAPTGTLRIPTAQSTRTLARDMHNFGLVIDPNGIVQMQSGASIENHGVFQMSGTQQVRFLSGNEFATFVNHGDFLASNNSGARFETNVEFVNHGLVETNSIADELRFSGGATNTGEMRIGDGFVWANSGFHNDGLIDVMAAGVMRFSAPITHGVGSDIRGLGEIQFYDAENHLTSAFAQFDGRITMESGTLNVYSFVTPGLWEFEGGLTNFHEDLAIVGGSRLMGGTIGGAGRLSFDDFEWNSGVLAAGGDAQVVAGGFLELTGEGTLSRTLENHGVIDSYDRLLTLSGGSLINSGTLKLRRGAEIIGAGAPGVIHNSGLIDVSEGHVSVIAGANLSFQNTGEIAIASSTTLRMSVDVAPGALGSVTGAGLLEFGGGTVTVVAGEIAAGLRVGVSGGSVTFNATPDAASWSFTGGGAVFESLFDGGSLLRTTGTAIRFDDGVTLAAGAVVEINGMGSIELAGGPMSAAEIQLKNGALLGVADATATDLLTWTGGRMGGAGRTIIGEAASAAIGGFGPIDLERELVNQGQAMWGPMHIRFDGGVLRNEGVFIANQKEGIPGLMEAQVGGGVFLNEGVLTKLGSGEMHLARDGGDMRFQNTGLLDVREGTVRLEGEALTTNGGTYEMSHAGSVAVTGDFANADGAALSFEVGGMKERGLSGLMTITGEASLAGTLSVTTPEAFSAAWGDRWVVMTYGSVEGDFDVFDLPMSGFASRSDEFGASDLRWYAERGATEYAVGVSHVADIDHDGVIGFSDLNLIASNYNLAGTWAQGDVDGDGLVGFTDLNTVLSLFNVTAPRSVPAPGGVAVFGLAACVSLRRKRD